MNALRRKLFRDLWKMRGQVLAIIAVVACGIASYVAMLSVHASLSDSAATYFERNRLPDVFAQVVHAPRSAAREVAAIPGVDAVETRIVEDVAIDVRGMSEPGVGRLISLPLSTGPRFNRLHMERGRLPSAAAPDEVAINEAFANAHDFALGEKVGATVGGRRLELRVVGVVNSPEYIFSVGPGSMFPDDRRFGVFWMGEESLAAAVNRGGGFNDLTLSLSRDANERDVIANVDVILERYGARGAVGRDKQQSARFIGEELKQLESMGGAVPMLFLFVAAFLLNVVLGRLISGQREQIAALKALGYSNLSVGVHYLEMMLVVVVGGTLLGAAAGGFLGQSLMGVYETYFRLPTMAFDVQPELVARASALSAAAGLLGTITALRRAVSLPPAEAMRPQAPATFEKGLLSRIGLGAMFKQPGRIVLRNVERRPFRTLLSSVGIAFGVGIMISGTFSMDALEHVMEVSFQRAQREDVTVLLARPSSSRVLEELRDMPGVLQVEPARNVPVRLRSEHHDYELAIQGLPPEGRMRVLLDADLNEVPVPQTGMLVTREVAKRLLVRPGQIVDVEILEGRARTKQMVVSGVVDEVMGMNAYASIEQVNALMDEGPLVNGARVIVDPAQRDGVYRRLKELPLVAGASLRTAVYDIFNETTGKMQTATAVILGILASIVTIGVVYNGARVVLAERSRELASLRVMGFTRKEVSTILLGELGVHVLVSLPLGCLLGWTFAAGIISGIDTELYRFPLIIAPETYLKACAVVVVAAAAAALFVRRRVDHLDLVAVLKTRE